MKDEDGNTPETQAGPDRSEGLLTRWSRRKLEAAGNGEAAPPPIPEAAEEQGVGADFAATDPELTDDDMPPIESLTEDSDYSVFLSPKVSEALRQQALQKLFRMTRFNVCDGLDDYAEDFTQFAGLGDIVTHEMRHMLERQKEKLAEALERAGDQSGSEQHPKSAAHTGESGQTPGPESKQEGDPGQESGNPESPDEPEEQALS
jgi:hypothetical protein